MGHGVYEVKKFKKKKCGVYNMCGAYDFFFFFSHLREIGRK